MNIFRKRAIPVYFKDYTENIVDRSLFEADKYTSINNNGIIKSSLNIIHAAAIHYEGRYRNSKVLRFFNAFMEIFSSIGEYGDGKFYLNNNESNEFQQSSSEVIAVGICIELTSELFNINKNRIYLIEGTKKRCDFKFIKNSLEYIIESKGRKGSTTQAIKDIFLKKEQYSGISPKYGVVSSLPRNGQYSFTTVVDPQFEPREISRQEEIQKLLVHYSKLSYLAGFWRMGDLLSSRAEALGSGTPLSEIDKKALDYENILKFGNSVAIQVGDLRSRVFFPRDSQYGFRYEYENLVAFFLMEEKLIKILNSQDFSALEEYSFPSTEDIEIDNNYLSIGNDGSILMLANAETINRYR